MHASVPSIYVNNMRVYTVEIQWSFLPWITVRFACGHTIAANMHCALSTFLVITFILFLKSIKQCSYMQTLTEQDASVKTFSRKTYQNTQLSRSLPPQH